MLNNKNTFDAPGLLSVYRALRDSASKEMEEAARLVREYRGGSPLVEETLDAAFDLAWEAFEEACDDLREVEHGYRHTFPHPAASRHPGDAYSKVLSSR